MVVIVPTEVAPDIVQEDAPQATRAPRPEQMERPNGALPPPPPPPLSRDLCAACCARSPEHATRHKGRNERVFYDSARARRSLLGTVHYCVACPGWSKATSERVVYSRWNLVPLSKLPAVLAAQCCGCCCCVPPQADWQPPPEPKTFASPGQGAGDGDCCACRLPCGRMLDTFDADIIVDASAHQTLLQICRGEGDVVLYRKAGADLSDPSEIFVMTDVVRPFDVYNDITFELSKVNLQGATTQALGGRMGAHVWNFDARAGTDHAARTAFRGWRGEREHVFFDSIAARRTCAGALLNSDLCCPPIYKVTSERVLFTEWDWWHPCDDDAAALACCPCLACGFCVRALALLHNSRSGVGLSCSAQTK